MAGVKAGRGLCSGVASLDRVMRGIISLEGNGASSGLPLVPRRLSVLSAGLRGSRFALIIDNRIGENGDAFVGTVVNGDILPAFSGRAASRIFGIVGSRSRTCAVICRGNSQRPVGGSSLLRFNARVNGSSSLSVKEEVTFVRIGARIRGLPDKIAVMSAPNVNSAFGRRDRVTHRFVHRTSTIVCLYSSGRPVVGISVSFVGSAVLPLPTIPGILFIVTGTSLTSDVNSLGRLVRQSRARLGRVFPSGPSVKGGIVPISDLSLVSSGGTAAARISSRLHRASGCRAIGGSVVRLVSHRGFF